MAKASNESHDLASQQEVHDYWLQCIRHWYPELQSRTYFLPPLHFTRVPSRVKPQADDDVIVPAIAEGGGACGGKGEGSQSQKRLSVNPVSQGGTRYIETPGGFSEIPETSQAEPCCQAQPRSIWQRLKHFFTPEKTDVSLSLWPRHPGDLFFSPLNDYDVCDVRTLQRVLHCLHALADDSQPEEVMTVISQFRFGQRQHHPSYMPACEFLATTGSLPPDVLQHRHKDGDTDILIIHRHYGLITLEIKSVGKRFKRMKAVQEYLDTIVMREIDKAVQQLNKAEVVLKQLVSDLAALKVTKSLVMPNITHSQLLRTLNISDSTFKQDLCRCLGVQSVDDAVKLCLLSDQLSDSNPPWNITSPVLKCLQTWWQQLTCVAEPQTSITLKDYELLLARFCGPATTVEIYCVAAPRLSLRILEDTVPITGDKMARLVLLPQQVHLLNMSPPRVFVTGPPGTGKTVLLVLQGVTCIGRRPNNVIHVVSTWSGSRAVTSVITHQIKETVRVTVPNALVYQYHYDFYKKGQAKVAAEQFLSSGEWPHLFIIADEVVPSRKRFTQFCDTLIRNKPRVYLWSASMHHNVRPYCLEEVKLTIPLRSPPVVVREVMKADEMKTHKVHEYTEREVHVSTDGPTIRRIKHQEGQSGHKGSLPRDCEECGHHVAHVLAELNVGQTDICNGRQPLRFRDVMVLCYDYPTDDWVDGTDQLTSNSRGLIQGLRACHVPVRVVKDGDEVAIHDMSLGVSDLVTVTHWHNVLGLESKVVVMENYECSDVFKRLYSFSRCSSQLVLIDW